MEEGAYTEQAAERIYQTAHYACGHETLRSVFRKDMSLSDLVQVPRYVTDYRNCPNCTQSHMRAIERREERRRSA